MENNGYPRPQMVRSNWQSLDGVWYCAFSRQRTIPDDIDTTIIVPFSPEAKCSGVCRTLKPEETMFYRKHFSYRHTPGTRVLLHFQAVDQECVVFLNEKTLGSHVGGYIPFWFDVTQNIREKNDLFVIVTDKHDLSPLPKGKQRLKPSTVFSAAQSGIWQSVWLEEVPWEYISSITLYPDLAGERFSLMVTTNTEGNNPVTVTYDGKTISGLSD
ncbi:MAG: sugar-binding domain-containing protein, partial [Sphaerochaetaceae bacterium]